jgi:hypothetical protein
MQANSLIGNQVQSRHGQHYRGGSACHAIPFEMLIARLCLNSLRCDGPRTDFNVLMFSGYYLLPWPSVLVLLQLDENRRNVNLRTRACECPWSGKGYAIDRHFGLLGYYSAGTSVQWGTGSHLRVRHFFPSNLHKTTRSFFDLFSYSAC